jgi:Icc-related predicted phosphoesterase
MIGYPSNVLVIADYPNYRFREHLKYRIDFVLSCGDVPYQVLKDIHERFGKPIYAVKGNHDPSGPFPEFIRDVHYTIVQERNWVIGGWEGVPAYKPSGGGMFDDFEAASYLTKFPYVDIFITHAPIYGKTDKDDYAHIGSEAILKYIEEKQPKYVYHGHTHQHAGAMIRDTAVVSVYGCKVVYLG